MPNMDGTGPFGSGRPGCGMGPCMNRDDSYLRPGSPNEQVAGSGLGPRFRNTRKPGFSSGMRNRFGSRKRGFGPKW